MGKLAADIASSPRSADLAEPIDALSGVLDAELVHAIEDGMGRDARGLLQRRCMAGLGGDFGLRAAPAAAAALVRLGIWDSARAAQELTSYRELAARHGARPLAVSGGPRRACGSVISSAGKEISGVTARSNSRIPAATSCEHRLLASCRARPGRRRSSGASANAVEVDDEGERCENDGTNVHDRLR